MKIVSTQLSGSVGSDGIDSSAMSGILLKHDEESSELRMSLVNFFMWLIFEVHLRLIVNNE